MCLPRRSTSRAPSSIYMIQMLAYVIKLLIMIYCFTPYIMIMILIVILVMITIMILLIIILIMVMIRASRPWFSQIRPGARRQELAAPTLID